MNLQEYFKFTETTKSYPNLVEYDYLTHGIWAEIGEFEGILAKRLRGDEKYKDDDYYFCSLKSELGDIYWFIVRILVLDTGLYQFNTLCSNEINDSPIMKRLSSLLYQIKMNLLHNDKVDVLENLDYIAKLLNSSRSEILELNVKKLTERKQTNTIKGNGETVHERFSLGK